MKTLEPKNMKKLTAEETRIIENLGDETYTPEFVEEWINRGDDVFITAPAALQSMGAKGFYAAVQRMAAINAETKKERFEEGEKWER